jgi:hypothetical protein
VPQPAKQQPLRCPSAQADMPDAQVLGVLSAESGDPRLSYLSERVPATPHILALAAPADPRQVFRLAARCEQARCMHFDGADCRLATRIVQTLPAVTDSLPPCTIRRTCRWYRQEGRAACLRCPQVVTLHTERDERMQQIAGMPSAACEQR